LDAGSRLVWTTARVPADNNLDLVGDKRSVGLTLDGGSVVRITELKPGFASPMHRTASIDYGIVLSGSLELVLDGGASVRLGPGDIVVQRGTKHLWRNPSATDECRIVFVMIEAGPVAVDGRVLEPDHL